MLDIKLLRNNIDDVAAQLLRRGYTLDVEAFNALESQRKSVQKLTQALQSERNTRSKAIGKARASGEAFSRCLMKLLTWATSLKQASRN